MLAFSFILFVLSTLSYFNQKYCREVLFLTIRVENGQI